MAVSTVCKRDNAENGRGDPGTPTLSRTRDAHRTASAGTREAPWPMHLCANDEEQTTPTTRVYAEFQRTGWYVDDVDLRILGWQGERYSAIW